MQMFDVVQYKLDYPQFSNVSDNTIVNTYNYAALPKSQWVFRYFIDDNQQYYWSCIVLSHILSIEYGIDGVGSSGLVGRITSASTDSVTASTDFTIPISNGSAWWNQTRYGAMVWSLWCSNGISMYVAGGTQ